MRWNEVLNKRVGRKVGTGKIESMETWRKKLGKYEENWNLENMKWENIKKIETVENMKSENIRKIGSVGNVKNMNLEIIKKNGNVEKENRKISRKLKLWKI